MKSGEIVKMYEPRLNALGAWPEDFEAEVWGDDASFDHPGHRFDHGDTNTGFSGGECSELGGISIMRCAAEDVLMANDYVIGKSGVMRFLRGQIVEQYGGGHEGICAAMDALVAERTRT